MQILGRRVSLVIIIPILLIFVGLFFVRREINQDQWDTLISRDFGYKIEYPTNWVGQVIKSGRGADYLHGRVNNNYLLPRSYLLIHSESMDNPTFKEGAIWGEEIILRDCGYICWEGFQPVEFGVNDYLALHTTYQEKVSFGQTLYNEAVMIVANDKVYLLQFKTYNNSKEIQEVFAHMQDSFEIIEIDNQ